MRNELIKLNSRQEYKNILGFLENLGEKFYRGYIFTPCSWYILQFRKELGDKQWALTNIRNFDEKTNFISYSDFISKYSKKEEPTTKNLDKYTFYIKGNNSRGKEVIQKLINLGAKNEFQYEGTNMDSFYYIRPKDDNISQYDLKNISSICTTELFLDEPVKEPEKVEVFPGIYVGDVVVSLVDIGRTRYKGNMFIVKNTSSKEHLRYDDLHKCPSLSYDKNDWRLATLEEKEAFKKGITNINDIKKETEEDFSKFIGQWVTYNKWSNKSVCKIVGIQDRFVKDSYNIYYDIGYVGFKIQLPSSWTANIKNLKILSKEELKDYLPKDAYNQEFPENIVPEYLELLPGYCTELNGTIFKTSEPYKKPTPLWNSARSWQGFWDDLPMEYRKRFFKASTKEEYEKQYTRPKFIKDVDPTVDKAVWINDSQDMHKKILHNPCSEIPLETKPNTFENLPFIQVKELQIF
jgi:hypothetical protein